MTQARVRFSNFEEYLSYSDKTPLEGRYLLIDGELVELPPESEPNNWIANHLQFLLVAAKVAPLRLIKIHSLELQVPVLHPGDAANRYPRPGGFAGRTPGHDPATPHHYSRHAAAPADCRTSSAPANLTEKRDVIRKPEPVCGCRCFRILVDRAQGPKLFRC